LKYDVNGEEKDYSCIDLQMKDIWSLKYLNLETKTFKLMILMKMDEYSVVEDQIVHNWIKKRIMFPFSTMIDVN